jgi:carboxyl-terminal processing protease
VVLINGRSASASEIVAGSLQDLDRGVIMGARSFGKGLVQRPKDLTYGTQLKVTISRYYTPSGRCIQALDYWNRDDEGKAVRIASKDYNEFLTRNGRKVYDGGGIEPDLVLESSEYSSITNEILQQNAIFDYATRYYYSHDPKSPSEVKLTEQDFRDFKTFLNSTDFEYRTFTEKQLEELEKSAELEDFDEELQVGIQQMEKTIAASKAAALDAQKEEILSLLTDEIIKRYYYKEGLYNYYASNNEEILAAQKVLNDQNKYRQILKK